MEKFIQNGKEYVANVNGLLYTQEEIETALSLCTNMQQEDLRNDAESFASQALGDRRAYWGRLASCLIRRHLLQEKVAFQVIE